jgi:hypothetical protein
MGNNLFTMLKVQRLAIVWSAIIFFLVISPVLAIYALGYDFDVRKNNLNSTVTLSIETAPENAKIASYGTFGNLVNYSNTDFRVATKDLFKVEMTREGFLSESFLIKGKDEENSLARLKKIHLLPSGNQQLDRHEANWDNKSFVSKDYIIYSQNENNQNNWFLQQYSYSGFLGDPKSITAQLSSSISDGLNNQTTTAPTSSTATIIQPIPTNSFWEEVDFDTFWQKDSQSLIFKTNNGNWKIWQSQFLGLGNLDIIWLGQNTVLLHDRLNTRNVYTHDLGEAKLTYITDNIKAASLNNNQIWFWHHDKIFRLNKEEIFDLSAVDWSSRVGYDFNDFNGLERSVVYEDTAEFKVRNVYQGVVIYINGRIFYQSDSQPRKWSLIAKDVQDWTSTWHSLFWIDSDNRLITFNLELNYERMVSVLNIDRSKVKISNLDYYAPWHRIFVYTTSLSETENSSNVESIWYNPDFVNNEIRTFSANSWLNEEVCRSFVEGGYIFCLNNDKYLISFRNLN